jgi:hypothetical protein
MEGERGGGARLEQLLESHNTLPVCSFFSFSPALSAGRDVPYRYLS